MIEHITYIESDQLNPYRNLGLEEQLLLNCQEQECILYLWQNKQTIVIGRNQNAWKECLTHQLREDGGHLVRRLSGGGAVYHDLGNLNFTFLVRKENYDLEKQLQVILRAVEMLGICAEKSGRNDILVDGRKFSGNAFYETGDYCYHHGTLMVDVNVNELSRYLTVSEEKLKLKGVDSVRSRVVNLHDLNPEITIESLKISLKKAFEETYGMRSQVRKKEDLNGKALEKSVKKFESREWIYGRKMEFQEELSHQFPWGSLTMQLQIDQGKIKDVMIFSDSMKPDMIESIPKYLKNHTYENHVLTSELSLYWTMDPQEEAMIEDIRSWLGAAEL
ncbi:lipoate--protein ligase [Hespellia stercorisuis]|uniref:lipoate--protein ligase n=1 Tax=Hespellia stercorisuis DSM 15480 TaxID=1121950 RepID=A0A1M6MMZ3_9FIRM|nr:lipoate--protein ligase [Hespellia stercorisuis]SHJ84756.1 lipoate-protein ligase [Hespellia stercorisuis DSM 15480]